MIVKYDSLNRLECPKFTLCNPGSVYANNKITKIVGMLADHSDEEIVFNFNASSELSFRVHRISRDNPDYDEHTLKMYTEIQNRKLVFVEDVGYFSITNIDKGYDNGLHYKDVTAKSIDVELEQKMIPYIADGTYQFTTDSLTESGIFDMVMDTIPLWSVGHVDDTIAERWRTFEDVDVSLNCLSFLIDSVQDAYECIILFDVVNRIVNVYDQDSYIVRTNIHLTQDDLIGAVDIQENADDLYTAMSVFGDDSLTIAAINPVGTTVIYNFDYYIPWMTEELGEKVTAWQTSITDARDNYYEISLEYYTLLSEASNLDSEISMYETQISMYTKCSENIVASASTYLVSQYNEVIEENGGTSIDISEDINETLASINSLIADCESDKEDVVISLDTINESLDVLRTQIDYYNGAFSITSYFSDSEIEELTYYIFECEYTDEYVITTDTMTYSEQFAQMKTLYDRAETQLENASSPTQEFSIDVENFLFVKEFETWSEQLETGCLINAEVEPGDIAYLFLSDMTVNYEDHTLSMTFGNRFNKYDPESLFENVLGNVSKSANTLSYIKDVIYPIKSGEINDMQEAIQSSRDLTLNAAIASDNQEVVIDSTGYTGKQLLDDGTYDPRQIKITGKSIVFTDDSWATCKTALGEIILTDGETTYGLNAETVIGDMIMGNNLRILDNDGNDLMTVVDGKIELSVSDSQEELTSMIEENKSLIEQTATNILLSVEETYVSNTDFSTFEETNNTNISQTASTVLVSAQSYTDTQVAWKSSVFTEIPENYAINDVLVPTESYSSEEYVLEQGVFYVAVDTTGSLSDWEKLDTYTTADYVSTYTAVQLELNSDALTVNLQSGSLQSDLEFTASAFNIYNANINVYSGSKASGGGTKVFGVDSSTGDLTFSGALSGATGSFSGSLDAATGTFSGSLSAATGTFKGTLSAATGTFSGSLSAATGTFSGTISTTADASVGNNINMNVSNTTSLKYINFTSTSCLLFNPTNSIVSLRSSNWVYLQGGYGGSYTANVYCTSSGWVTLSASDTVHLNGSTAVTSSKTVTVSSDERVKDNIADVETDWIYGLQIKQFTYIDDTYEQKQNYPYVGIIAQSVLGTDAEKYVIDKNLFPSETGEEEQELYSVDYQAISMALVQEVQKLEARVEELEKRNINE